jgi:hypothetical protein
MRGRKTGHYTATEDRRESGRECAHSTTLALLKAVGRQEILDGLKMSNVIGLSMFSRITALCAMLCVPVLSLRADSDVYLVGSPDYSWYAGCFGTACGNLMGYWDRHGFPDFYTGPTAGGVAPLNDFGTNRGIRALWANRAGFDGRPANQPGHIDDYWLFYTSESSYSYESTAADPYITAGRPEHPADCIGDFIGLSQRKWSNMNGECDGNIDAYSFVYWDTNGNRRVNYTQMVDIQSGLRAWTEFRGSKADVFTQLADFNPRTPAGRGFTFADVKAEIDAGYPFMVFLQDYGQYFRSLPGMSKGNPDIHGMMVYGYQEYPEFGINYVRCRTSWGSGDSYFRTWTADPWVVGPGVNLSVRGVIGYRPKPKVRSIERSGSQVTLKWDGPASRLYDALGRTTNSVHRYQVEHSTSISGGMWSAVGVPTTELELSFANADGASAFFRVRLLGPGE